MIIIQKPAIMFKTHSFFTVTCIAFCVFFCCITLNSLSAIEYNLIPYPQNLTSQSGTYKFNKHTVILCSFQQPEVLKLAQQFADQFELVSGKKLVVREIANADTTHAILFRTVAFSTESVEAYNLRITPLNIIMEAQAPSGFFYALQTLYQLMPAEIYAQSKISVKNWKTPCVLISESPRFAYRGLHLDVVRHFFSVEFIKKYINAMAIHKLNSFHWHLTDDQGWRIEIKKYPRLTEVASRRDETLIGHYYENFPQQFDGKPYGGFYTQEDAKEIVAYAKERFITVIPEIELPGHAQAAIAAYPYLSCTQDSTIKVATKWGVFKDVYCSRETTFTFLEDVLTEVMAIFPSNYIHIGGDESPKDRWKNCPHCQALIKSKNLKDEHELQSYFVQRIEQFVNSKGRKIIGWDEILEGGLAPNATVMSWRGIKGGIAAAQAGHDVIMTPGDHCYFDYYQSDPITEPTTIGGYTPLSKVYSYEPIPSELTKEESKHILGAQANVWTEYMPTSESVEYMAFPRLSAMAEVVWGSKENRNWDSFRKRMSAEFDRYDWLNIGASKAFFDVQFQSLITVDKKLQLSIVCDQPDAEIHYTTNGKVPTKNDAFYVAPFILTESAKITAVAFVKNKLIGKAIVKTFQISKLTGLDYTRNVNNTWYNGGNELALTDGVMGNTKVYTHWVGIGNGSDGEIVVDMKKSQSVQRFSVGLLNAPALCVMLSPEIKLFGSVDGVKYKLLAEKQLDSTTSGVWEMFRPELNFPLAVVRYLKLTVKNAGICPADRPHGGNGSLLFLDEVGVW